MKLTSAAFLKQYDNINKNEGVRRALSVHLPTNEVYSKNMKDDLLHGVYRNNIIPGTSTHLKRTHIGVELSKRDIASVLDTIITDTLLSYTNGVIGSDEKKALEKVDVNDKNAKQNLFGNNHLAEADTTVDFTANVTKIGRTYKDLVGLYFTRKVISTFRDYVYNARK
ncbi:unnamed protein product [Mytilus edulis]|uniref:Uncharacterized protein n=1 Tax=Mytilus edulis TaxID=6550 RepID=A0A8S3SCV4_MYTED|nr:unnamed protein product [Mytilus edulis]